VSKRIPRFPSRKNDLLRDAPGHTDNVVDRQRRILLGEMFGLLPPAMADTFCSSDCRALSARQRTLAG